VPGLELSEPENRMLASAARGDWLRLGRGPFELAEMVAWPSERTIRASVLRQLLIGEQWPTDPKGVRLAGARISGHLDFEAATLRCPLLLDDCYLDAAEAPCFDHARAQLVRLTGCHMAGIRAESLTATEFGLRGSTVDGPVRLNRADISGSVTLTCARLTSADERGIALAASWIKVGGGLFLDRFTAAGAVMMPGAKITGQVTFKGAQLTSEQDGKAAVIADSIKVTGGLILDDLEAAGAVRLPGADITSSLTLSRANLKAADRDGDALVADGLKVEGQLYVGCGFTAAGAVRLPGADITRHVILCGAQLTSANTNGNALDADGVKVKGNLFLGDGFAAAGAVRFSGADIAGQVSLGGARLTSDHDGDALIAERLKIGEDLLLGDDFAAAGTVRLSGADIAGQVSFGSAQLTSADSKGDAPVAAYDALVADGIRIGEDLIFDTGFNADGAIRLRSATVGGSLYLKPTKLAQHGVAVDASDVQVADSLEWAPASRVVGQVILEGASAGQLADSWADGEKPNHGGHWPAAGLRLDGFRYARIGGASEATAEQRLDWIRSQYQPDADGQQIRFAAQPYEQLASVYRQAGQDREARIIAVARRADLRRHGDLAPHQKAANWLLYKTIRYGYQTGRAAAGLAVVYLLMFTGSIIA
jgi:hypothetical protein